MQKVMGENKHGRLEYMLGNPCEGVNVWLRDTYLGFESKMWDAMQQQRLSSAITDICILFTRYIRRNDNDYVTPILAKNVIGGYKILPLGEDVARILAGANLRNCEIVQYSINANKVGGENANNRFSVVIYAHFDMPHTQNEVFAIVDKEMENEIFSAIKDIIVKSDSYIGVSNYNDRDIITDRKDLEELLMCGSGCRFTEGHFYQCRNI